MSTGTTIATAIQSYGGNEVSSIAENTVAFMKWVSRALVNRHEDVCVFYNKWTKDSFTFSAKGFEEAVPTDWDRISTMNLYTDSDYQYNYDEWEMQFGVHRFRSQQAASQKFYRRYRQAPSVYTDMTTDIPELADPRIQAIVEEEVIAMFLSADNDLENSDSRSTTLNNADRIS